ncbi:MAG TPA: hypothetical protein VM286_07835 [Candidatus Thermoplasmatota archaeon]|nr:hypothetical protein [Candidatus Thermoplasmatota archaeon]
MPSERIWPWTGAALVALAVVLVVALPRPEVVPPQFRVTFPEEPTSLPGGSLALGGGGEGDLAIEVPGENLTRVVLTLLVQDDLPASEPDRFEVEVRGPDGSTRLGVASATPGPVADGQVPPRYSAPGRILELVAVWSQPPREGFVDGHPGDSVQSVAERVASERATAPAPQWTMHARLLAAGPCPGPDLDAPRAAACRQASPTGADDGNPLVVTGVRAYHFHAVVAPN